MRGSPFFEGIEQMPVATRGYETRTPTFYYDVGFMEAVFPARLAALRTVLPDRRFVPLRVAPGVGAVVLDCFEYRDSDVGPYDEIAISVVLADREVGSNVVGRQLVGLQRRRQGHAFVVHMPVTTKPALALGTDFFAFPKFLAEIEWSTTADGGRRCRLSDGREHVLTLVGSPLATAGRRTWQAFAHLWMQGQPQRAEVRMNQLQHGRSFRPGAARLEIGDRHPIARELDRLMLSRRSIEFDLVPRQEAILFGPDHLTLALIARTLAGAWPPAATASS